MLLEVGLGGRLDATNLVESDVAVVTTIALDHCDWLGDTREAIATEKAGIYRQEKPAISGEPEPPLTQSRRVGGANYQVPVEVRPSRRMALAMRWLREAARKRSEKSMGQRLAAEMLEASENRGGAVKESVMKFRRGVAGGDPWPEGFQRGGHPVAAAAWRM